VVTTTTIGVMGGTNNMVTFRAFPFKDLDTGETIFCLVEDFGEWRERFGTNYSVCEDRRHLTRAQLESLHNATKAALEAADEEQV